MKGSTEDGVPPLDAWGLGGTITRLAGGAQQAVFRVAGAAGDVVLKTTRRTEAQVRWAEDLRDAARAAGFTVPRLRKAQSGAVLVDGWTCEDHVPGRRATEAEAAASIGLVRRMHRLSEGLTQRPGFRSAAELCAASEGGDVDFAAMPDDVAAACRASFGALLGVACTGIHGDLHAGNMIVTEAGRVALIDWEEARVDAPVFDLAVTDPIAVVSAEMRLALVAWEVAVCWKVEPLRARELAVRLMRG